MLCLDVNVLLYAAFEDSRHHESARALLASSIESRERLGLSSAIASSFVRLATSRRVFSRPLDPPDAVAFLDALRSWPQVVALEPGPGHWPRFRDLVVEGDLRDRMIPDAWLAALALEHAAAVVSFDRDFARFPNVRWIDPTRL